MNELDATLAPPDVPPPVPELLARVDRLAPVRTRRRGRALLLAALACALYPGWALNVYPVRQDMNTLPRWWAVLAGVIWALGFCALLVHAFLPPRGQVLPDPSRAGRTAVLVALALISFGLGFTLDAPCCTIVPERRWPAFALDTWHCLSFGLRISLPLIIVGGVLLRRVLWVGGARIGLTVGAAGGALAGFTLHVLCPIGGALHVGLAHGGGVVLGALIGGISLGLLSYLRSDRRSGRPRPSDR